MEINLKRLIEIPGYYELKNKVNHWKKKYEEDTTRLQSLIKEQMERIEELKERIKLIEAEDHYYQLWLKEREELIKKAKENNKLIEEIIALKKKITNEIIKSVAEKDIYKKIIDGKFEINWLEINKSYSRHLEIFGDIALKRFQELEKKASDNTISKIETIENLALQLILVPDFDNETIISSNPNHLIEFKESKKEVN